MHPRGVCFYQRALSKTPKAHLVFWHWTYFCNEFQFWREFSRHRLHGEVAHPEYGAVLLKICSRTSISFILASLFMILSDRGLSSRLQFTLHYVTVLLHFYKPLLGCQFTILTAFSNKSNEAIYNKLTLLMQSNIRFLN